MSTSNGVLPRLVCSASDLYQGHSLSSRYYRKQGHDIATTYVPSNAYELSSVYSPTCTLDSDFSSQDLDSSGYFSAISSREFWDTDQRQDPYGIVRSAFELRDVKSKRKILTNGSLKQSCNNSAASSLNNSVGELKELKVHQPLPRLERQPIECTFRPIREPQTPEPMYPEPNSIKGMTKEGSKGNDKRIIGPDALSTHNSHPYYSDRNGHHSDRSTSESGYSSHSQDSKDFSKHVNDSKSNQKDCRATQNDVVNYTCNSQVNKINKGHSDKHTQNASPQRTRYPDHSTHNRDNQSSSDGTSYQSNITSSSRDIYEISRMVGSAKELSQRHQRKMSQSGRTELSLPGTHTTQTSDDLDLSNMIGSAKDLIDNASKTSGRRQFRRRIDSREEDGPVVLIRSNENLQKYLRDYILPVSVKEGHATTWDYFMPAQCPPESSTDHEEVYAADPCRSCPEFQQYGVETPKPTPVLHPPGALQIAAVDLPRAPPPVKVVTEDICIAPDVLREPERPKPSSYMPLSIAVCLLCSIFAISTVILSVRTQRALKRGDNRKSRKLSHITFWLNIAFAVFGAFTYLVAIVVIYVVIHHKGVSIKLV